MKTFAIPGSSAAFATAGQQLLVGRKVANIEFLKALFRHGSFDRFSFLAGEATEERFLREFFVDGGLLEEERFEVQNSLNLPRLLKEGAYDVIHNGSHLDAFLDMVWTRDRYAKTHVPVTGHIFSLSYPRMMSAYLRFSLLQPGAGDAIICCSEVGRKVVYESVAALSDSLEAAGRGTMGIGCPMPVIPFGVDVARLAFGDRAGLRSQHGIPDHAVVLLSMARFTEYDKMDLFPLIQCLPRLVAEGDRMGVPVVLLLAGASQGLGTVQLLQQWAKALKVDERILFLVDFEESEKSDILAAADLFVSPCDNPQETFGLSVVEAMAAGLPVVVSDFDGYRETVSDAAGARVPTTWGGDWEEIDNLGPLLYERPLHLMFGQSVAVDLGVLEAHLLELIANEELRRSMGAAAARHARENYDWGGIIGRHEELWDELAAAGASEPSAPRSEKHPMRMPLKRIFGHYPSCWLDPERELQLSSFAVWLRERALEHPIYREVQPLVSQEMVSFIVDDLEGSRTVGQLLASLRRVFSQEEDRVADYSLIWMLKHGLLS